MYADKLFTQSNTKFVNITSKNSVYLFNHPNICEQSSENIKYLEIDSDNDGMLDWFEDFFGLNSLRPVPSEIVL